MDEEKRAAISEPRSFLPGALEYYLCGIFPLCKKSEARGWWCDGILELSITELSPTAFQMIGVAYWAGHKTPFYLAPFELEFYFDNVGELESRRVVFRFGSLNERGTIKHVKHNFSPSLLLHRRPQQNSDWALAIELS